MARFTNQAQLRYGNEITNSNIAVGEITEVLSATKTAVRDTYGQNENVTYVISIVNSGTTAFNGITVTDNLGEYLFNTRELTPLTYIPGTVKYYANGILQATPAVTAGPPLTITGITVPAGGNVTLTYEAEVNSYAPLAAEASITNTATIAGAGVTPVTVNETVNAVSGPLLTITKSVSPVPVTENGTLTCGEPGLHRSGSAFHYCHASDGDHPPAYRRITNQTRCSEPDQQCQGEQSFSGGRTGTEVAWAR